MIPPPTHSIAAVPIAEMDVSSPGTPRTRPRPIACAAARPAFGHVQADVVQFHDQSDHAIDRDGDRDPDRGQREALHCKRIAIQAGERDRHDLGRQDEVGADRALDLARLELGRRVGGEQFGFGMMVAD